VVNLDRKTLAARVEDAAWADRAGHCPKCWFTWVASKTQHVQILPGADRCEARMMFGTPKEVAAAILYRWRDFPTPKP
jgi:hypothetical protein